jgi:hypothetical protein
MPPITAVLLVPYSISPWHDLTSHILWILSVNLCIDPKNLIFKLSNAFCVTYRVHYIKGYDSSLFPLLIIMVFLMLIRLDALTRDTQPLDTLFIWVLIVFLGPPRSSPRSPALALKLNTELWPLLPLNYLDNISTLWHWSSPTSTSYFILWQQQCTSYDNQSRFPCCRSPYYSLCSFCLTSDWYFYQGLLLFEPSLEFCLCHPPAWGGVIKPKIELHRKIWEKICLSVAQIINPRGGVNRVDGKLFF